MRTSAVLVLLTTACLVQARVVKRELVTQTFGKWTSLGCYSDSQSNRTLTYAAYFGEYVTGTDCQYKCQQQGYIYAGTEYSGQCYCDNKLNTPSTKKPESDCSMACSGDDSQPCGGPDRINIFFNDVNAPNPPPPSQPPNTVNNYTSFGCWTDNINARALPFKANTAGGASRMTVGTCIDACAAANYTLAAAEYGNECYCGNAIERNQTTASDQSSCNMPCKGDKTIACGGAGRMNLYSLSGAQPAIAVPVVPVKPTLPTGWTGLGCYTDLNDKRALSKQVAAPSSGMTVEYCVNKCQAQGFAIAGVEYGGECYCDNGVQNNHGLAADGDAQCNKPCAGNAGETCGGASRLNVYAAGPHWVKVGCFIDQGNARTLAVTASYSGQLTVEKCQATCQASGYVYSGVEYGNECHCGNSIDNKAAAAADGNANCNFKCAGNSSQICGGSNRLSLYTYITTNGTIQSAPGQTTVVPVTKKTGLPSGWSYNGCYNDEVAFRTLATVQPESDSQTIGSCIAACASAGFAAAGVEYGTQCYCDNAIENGAALANNGSCSMACAGDASSTCGGRGAVDVYSTGPLITNPKPTPQETGLPASWHYDNCYVDSVNARDFAVTTDLGSSASAVSCINYCDGQGFPAAGVEFGSQCYCGTAQEYQKVWPYQSTACTMTCAGDAAHICGGSGAITVFATTKYTNGTAQTA